MHWSSCIYYVTSQNGNYEWLGHAKVWEVKAISSCWNVIDRWNFQEAAVWIGFQNGDNTVFSYSQFTSKHLTISSQLGNITIGLLFLSALVTTNPYVFYMPSHSRVHACIHALFQYDVQHNIFEEVVCLQMYNLES